MSTLELVIAADGAVTAIYADELLPVLQALGTPEIRRASHVEPWGGGWTADMRPSGGPILTLDGPLHEPVPGHDRPFPTRAEALRAEVEWIRRNVLGAATCAEGAHDFYGAEVPAEQQGCWGRCRRCRGYRFRRIQEDPWTVVSDDEAAQEEARRGALDRATEGLV